MDLEREHPDVKQSLLKSLGNVQPRHLLDRRLNPPSAAVVAADSRSAVSRRAELEFGQPAGLTSNPPGRSPALTYAVRAVLQRVSSASVTVGERVIGAIGSGLLVLIGIEAGDGPDDRDYIVAKIRDVRMFSDAADKMNRSVADTGGAVLVVSQFTLCGDVRKGRRPSFDQAAPPAEAKLLYEDTVRALRETGLRRRDRRVSGDDAGGARERRTGHDLAGQQAPLLTDATAAVVPESWPPSVSACCAHARAGAQQRPLTTEDPEVIGAGRVLVEAGVESGQNARYFLSGLKGDRVAMPVGVSVGLGDIAELQLDAGYTWFGIDSRTDAPLAYRVPADATHTSDVIDLTVATKIHICGEGTRRPAFAVRFATRLPNASNESGLGLDTTDFYFSILGAKTFGSWRVTGNAGLGILSNPLDCHDPGRRVRRRRVTGARADGAVGRGRRGDDAESVVRGCATRRRGAAW